MSLADNLRGWWWRQQFVPGPLAWLINPFFIARRGLWRGLSEFFPQLRGELLDVGCGRKPYAPFVPATRYVGLDLDSPVTRELAVADVYYDGGRLPFADATFDAVLCSQVLEHVFTPEEFLREVRRVLRPGGRLLLATPFVWDEHEQPHDFGRYSSFGLRALLERTGFVVEAQRKTAGGVRALAQLGAGYLFKVTRTRLRVLNWFVQLVLIAPVTLVGWIVGALLPRHEDLYLDNIVLVSKPVDQ